MNDYVMSHLVQDRQGRLLAEAKAHRLGRSARHAPAARKDPTAAGRPGPVRAGLGWLLGRSAA